MTVASTAVASAVLSAGICRAELTVPAVISSGMVLNQESSAPIWGTAEPGQPIQVTASWADGTAAELQGTADSEGRWSLVLRTPSASKEPASITIRAGEDSLQLDDVLVGEVWLCSGQSNMEWKLEAVIDEARERGELPPDMTALEPKHIRHFIVPRSLATEPQSAGGGHWHDSSGSEALKCSAVAYFFAQRLVKDLDVPVGLIVSSWGGTPAQSWVSPEVAAAFPDHAQTLADVRANEATDGISEAQIEDFWNAADDKAFFARRFRRPDFDDSHWDRAMLPVSYKDLGLGEFNGVVWFRTEVDVPPSWAGQDLELQLPPLDDLDETLWNGERVGSEMNAGSWSVKRRYPIPGSKVTAGSTSLTVRILDTGGYGGFGAGKMRLVNGDEWIELAGPWRYRKGVTAAQAGTPPRMPKLDYKTPSSLFNAMIAPLRPYGIRGILWYQGESNRERPKEYRTLFPALIMDWRKHWNDLALPFYFVQIAPYAYRKGKEGSDQVAVLRESQAVATKLPRTGMALTADIGNPRNIHPKNKWEVGRRLSLFALRDLYGQDDLEPNGPTYREAQVDGASMILFFDHVAGALHASGETIEHFELRNQAGSFIPARAEILGDGQSIRLEAPGVDSPTGARYLWGDAPESSLSGGTGLPMAPFRTIDSYDKI